MYLRSRLLLAGLILCFNFLFVQSQTLYWVGGSGNFNDPQHWSLSSGGPAANVTPNSSHTVIFDNESALNSATVNVASSVTLKGLRVETFKNIFLKQNSLTAKFTLTELFQNFIDNLNFEIDVPIVLNNNGQIPGTFSSGSYISSDVRVTGGKWAINKLLTHSTNSVEIQNADLTFLHATIIAGNLSIKNCQRLLFDNTVLKVSGVTVITNCPQNAVTNTVLNKKRFSISSGNFSSGVSSKLGGGQINAPCVPTPTVVKPTCSPGCDGKIIFTLPSFACFAPFTPTAYVVELSSFCSSAVTMTVPGAGTYTFTNLCSCTSDYALIVNDESGFNILEVLVVPVTQNNISNFSSAPGTSTINCFGNCTGSVNVTFFGGTAPYNFTISPPSGPQTFSTTNGAIPQSSLCAGTLSIFTRDAGNCTATFTRQFTAPSSLATNGLTFTPICNSDCTAGYTVSPTGGSVTTTYTVDFSTGGSFNVLPGNSASVNGLCAPVVITSTITDKNNCKAVNTVSITQPSSIIITPTQTNVGCFGTCTGTAQVSVTGGGGSYNYTWSAGASSSSVATGLCAGVRQVTVTDIPYGCAKVQSFTITENAPIAISSTFTNVICNSAATGALSSTISGGLPNFSVTLARNTGSAVVFNNAASGTLVSVSNLPADTYTLYVTDAVPCSTLAIFTITQSPSTSLTAVTQSNTCPGGTAGSVTLSASGGNGPAFSYSINNVAVAAVTGALATNTYVAVSSDVAGCISNPITFTITEPPVFSFNVVTTTLNCYNSSTGSLVANPSGGSAPYSFTLASGAGSQSNATGSFVNLPGSQGPLGAGVYTLTIGDSFFPGSCAQSTTLTVDQPTSTPTSTIAKLDPSCFGVCNGTLTGSASGGTGPFTYNWITPTTTINNTITINNQCAGQYSLNVVDSRGCAAPQQVITLVSPSQVTLAINATSISCSGTQGPNANGAINTTVTGGSGPYTYTWSGPGAFSSNAANISSLAGGIYTLNYSANGCTQTPVTQTINTAIALALSNTIISTSCASLCDGTVQALASGGRTPYAYQFAGSTPFTNASGNFPGVCGNFTVTVTDANTCTTSITNSVTVPGSYALTGTTINQVSCFGLCDGGFTTTPAGGIAPYTYTLAGPTTTNTSAGNSAVFTGLCANPYTLFVRDASVPATCSQTFAINITQPAALGVTVVPTPATCYTVCNGAFNSTVTGGSSAYSYTYASASNTANVANPTGLCANPYTVTIRDNVGGCTFTTTSTITQPTIIALNSSVITSVTCNGGNNGAIAITPTGGPSTSYSYSWSAGGFTTSSISGLTAGLYSVVVTSGACTNTFGFNITAPSSMSLSAPSTSLLCRNVCTGSSTLIVSGGTAPYTYSLQGNPINGTGLFSGLCSGTLNAVVTDSFGCTASTVAVIANPASSVVISAVATQSSCASCSGGATVTAAGGTGALNYIWTNSLGVIPVSTTTIGGLCPSTGTPASLYTITARDANSCTALQTFSVPEVIILVTASSGSVTCAGATDGSATVTASGGQPGYSYTWSPTAPVQTSSVASGLGANVYTVQVRDSSTPANCITSQTLQILPVNSISVTANTFSPSCFATTDGSVVITPSGGPSASYTFSWTSTNTFTATTQNANSIPSGTYFLTVTSGSLGCSSSFTYPVNSPSLITNVFTVSHPSNCATPNTGTIVSSPAGGNGTYSLSWAPGGATTSSISNIAPGSYTLTVNSGSCTQDFTTVVNTPVSPTISLVSSASVACNSGTTGSASFSTTGSAPYQFTWTPAATASVVSGATTTANGLTAGTYSARVTDANNCVSNIATVSIVQPPALSFTTSITPVVCPSASTGVITLSVSQGTLASNSFTYNWSNGTNTTGSVSTVNNLTATPVTGTSYTATVVNAVGCSSSTVILVPGPANFSFSTQSASLNCNGISTGSIGVLANPPGGTTYSWTTIPSGTFSSTNSTITALPAGLYSVTVKNAAGCIATGISTIQISQPPALVSTLTVNHNVTCFNGSNGGATFSVTGGTGPYTYSWTPGGYITAVVANSLTAQFYSVVALDAQSCIISGTANITGPSLFNATLTPFSPQCVGMSNGSITTQVTGGQGNITYSWQPAGSGQSPAGLNAGTGSLVYTLTATDDSLCVFTKTIALVDPPALGTSLTFTDPVCFGNCNGSAAATVTNAVGTPTVTWTVPTQTPSIVTGFTANNLCSNPFNGSPNIYSVSVIDSKGCSNTATFALNTPSQIAISYTSFPSVCSNGQGSIIAVPSGGTGSLTMTWTGPAGALPSGTVQAGLSGGLYTISVIDVMGCSTTSLVPVTTINGPTATVSSNTIQCPGASTGSFGISNLQTGVTFTWLPPISSSVTTQIVTGLTAGTYSVQLQNTSGCLSFYGVTISQPPPFSILVSSVVPTCYGICDGSLSVQVSGGTPSYSYNWSGPVSGTVINAPTISNLCGGSFTLTVVDANTCSFTPQYIVPVLNSITVNTFVTNTSCFSNCNGSATIQVVTTTTVGTTATIAWGNGQFGPASASLCAGNHSAMVTDTRGCFNVFNVDITEPSDMTVTPVVAGPNCNLCNGSVAVTASGGNGPAYSFSWTTGANTSTLTDLCAGIYQVVVSDNANCRQTKNVIINNSNGIIGDSVIVTDELCVSACNGAATVIAKGGTNPISYSWINPNLSLSANTASNLCPGTYFVQMRDANNCQRITSLVVNSADSLIISTFITPPNCTVTPPNGTVVTLVEGNKGSLTYSWSPGGSTNPDLNNIGPGSYTLTVTDALTGCTRTTVVAIGNPESPTVTSVQQNIDCTHALGSITVTAASAGTVSYAWSNGSVTPVIGSLNQGPLTLTVTDGSGCIAVNAFTIDSLPGIELLATSSGIKCNNGSDGSIVLLGLNGSLPYTYSLAYSGGTVAPGAFQNFSLSPGTYTASINDKNGCRAATTVSLSNPVAITSTLNATNASCSSLADGSATAQVSGGKAPYTYSWTSANGFSSTLTTLSNVLAATYSLTVTDTLNCKSKTSTITIAPTVTVIANAGPDFTVCPGTEVVFTGSNSVGAVSYHWYQVPKGAELGSALHFNVTGVETTTFQLETVASVAGCFALDTVVLNVYVTPYLDAGPSSFTMPVYSSTVIGGSPTSLAGGPTHTWAPAQYLDNPEVQNPVASNTNNVTYTVSIEYGDHCLVSDTVQVLIIPEVKVNSGFSPNSDGKNDFWIIDYIDQFPENTVEVYNRWGEQLFYSKGYHVPWDGTYKGQPVPVGTYYYVIRLNHFAYTKPYTGPVTVFR